MLIYFFNIFRLEENGSNLDSIGQIDCSMTTNICAEVWFGNFNNDMKYQI